jgi:hypothetical protein
MEILLQRMQQMVCSLSPLEKIALLFQSLRSITFSRKASTSSGPATSHYSFSRRTAHIGIPLLAWIALVYQFTDPSKAPQPLRKTIEKVQGTICKENRASDLNRYIKSHPDESFDEHTIGWNKLFSSFKEHRKREGHKEYGQDSWNGVGRQHLRSRPGA